MGIFFGHFQPLLDTLTIFGDFWRTFLKISAVCRNLTHQHQFESFFGTVGLFCAIFFGPLDKPGHWTWGGGREITIVIFCSERTFQQFTHQVYFFCKLLCPHFENPLIPQDSNSWRYYNSLGRANNMKLCKTNQKNGELDPIDFSLLFQRQSHQGRLNCSLEFKKN